MCRVRIRASDIVAVYRNLQHKKNLKRDEELKNEMRKGYVCQRCGRGFAYPRGLYRHKKYTCDAKACFFCDLCSYKSKYKSDIITHIRNMHSKNKQHDENTDVNGKEPERNCKCIKCGRCYADENGLYKHKKYVCDAEATFVCGFCGHKFKRKGDLRRHIVNQHLIKHQRGKRKYIRRAKSTDYQ